MLNTLGKVVAVLLALTGLVWILQGVNLLPGSYMTGDPQWAVNGAITAAIGIALFWYIRRRKS
ncbi:MAG: hypothetical protein DPW18_04115 [Chloroflexi bacterium]|nr:hypothetical protein [Chloroflexota bacterium]MDL1941202.1 hypothetical protein [Chloroflexi bacterium CFX2]